MGDCRFWARMELLKVGVDGFGAKTWSSSGNANRIKGIKCRPWGLKGKKKGCFSSLPSSFISAYLFMCLTPHSLEHHLCVTSSIVLLWPDSFWVLCFRTLLLSFICTLTFSLSLIIYSSPLSTLPLPWRLSLWIASVNSCLLDSENPAEKS